MKYCIYLVFISILSANLALAEFSDADLNHDGLVDELDFNQLSVLWLNDCYEQPCYNCDIENDGIIDFYDFAYLSGNWHVIDYNSYQIAYWPLDEGQGFIANDSTQNGNNAVFQNMDSSSWAAGKRDSALYFDGNNDYLSIYEQDNGLGQYFDRDFSITLWVKLHSIQQQYQTVIGIESTNRFTTYGFEGFTIELDYGVPLMYIAYEDDKREIVSASQPLPLDNWTHLCIVRQGDVLKIYLNGKLDTSQVITDMPVKFNSQWPGYDVIGATKDSYYGLTTLFNGWLDEIHLYNFAISENLIHKLAQQDYAWLPEPRDKTNNVSTDIKLNWQKGAWPLLTACHDIYLGEDYNAVSNADINTLPIYKNRQTSCLFDPCSLESNTWYYWRVDDINESEIHKGNVWSFKTSGVVYSIEASSSQAGYEPHGAFDGSRFDNISGKCWKGLPNQNNWYWQINFQRPQQIGSILMVMGENKSVLQNSPLNYKWRYSNDGSVWFDLNETSVTNEKRLFRISRLNTAVTITHLRLQITNCTGSFPTIREIELYSQNDSAVNFDDWVIAVNITEYPDLPGVSHTDWFIDLARDCAGWQNIQGQQIWLPDFNEFFLNIEPYPLCVFLSGSYNEWCQRTQSYFAGLQEVVINGNIPIWGSCGGAQVLGLLVEPGYEYAWDCPRCRYVHNPPWSPIYGHIGYINPSIEPQECGNYDNCRGEWGVYSITKVTSDPVLDGLNNTFLAYESHVGQLEYLPNGWHQVATAGPGASTNLQCFRRNGRYIYGAQFHIENYAPETWQNSIQIMSNFLNLAQQSGGYQQAN